MTFTWDQELAEHIRYIAEYEDGSKHVFAVPQSTLEQGLPNEGRYSIACIIAYEWQQDGYLKPGTATVHCRHTTQRVRAKKLPLIIQPIALTEKL